MKTTGVCYTNRSKKTKTLSISKWKIRFLMISRFRTLTAVPQTAGAMLRLMAGIARNRLRRPERPSLLVDTQGIIETFVNYAVQ